MKKCNKCGNTTFLITEHNTYEGAGEKNNTITTTKFKTNETEIICKKCYAPITANIHLNH